MKGCLMLRFWGEWRMTVSGYKDPTWGDENTLKPTKVELYKFTTKERSADLHALNGKMVLWTNTTINAAIQQHSATNHTLSVWGTAVATGGNNLEEGIKTMSIDYGKEFN